MQATALFHTVYLILLLHIANCTNLNLDINTWPDKQIEGKEKALSSLLRKAPVKPQTKPKLKPKAQVICQVRICSELEKLKLMGDFSGAACQVQFHSASVRSFLSHSIAKWKFKT